MGLWRGTVSRLWTCIGSIVFLLLGGEAAAHGQFVSTTVYSSGNIAAPIPDNTGAPANIHLNVTDAPRAIIDADVRVRLNHTFDSDLAITLVHPQGTRIELSTNNDGSGDNYGSGATDCSATKTVFDDSAATSITTGTPPYAGSFRPEQALAGLQGRSTKGDWVLEVKDSVGLDTGTVYCVELVLTSVPAAYDVDGDGTQMALTDGILILRWLFGFRGSTLITNAVGTECTRCSAADIAAYLDQLDL
jgi:subtilisin-like proprotein convertase family protein